MELQFNKVQNRWEAEFEATADFNLHIEGVLEKDISVFQRGTASGYYALVRDSRPNPTLSVRVYDYDFAALTYPKYIKVSCATEPTMAEVVSNGEVTELFFQSKTVEVKKNGTTTISPDKGFTALNSVKVKVNVPTEGGGSSSSDGGYKDVNFFDYDGTLLYAYSWEEAKNLTELPALPVHDGLEVREWNYTLEDIQAQGVKYFEDAEGRYQYVGKLTIDGVTYQAWNVKGDYSDGYWAFLVTSEPKEGGICYYAWCYNNDGTAWVIDADEDGKYYEYEITEVGETIGKADVGACVYDENGELVMTNGTYIIERGTTSIDDIELDNGLYMCMFKILSIPATVTYVGQSAFQNFTIEHLRMPINIEYGFYYNSAFSPTVIDSIWINGCDLNTNIIDSFRGLSILHIPPTFSTFQHGGGYLVDSHIIYVPETIHTIKSFSFPGNQPYVIFNNHKFVPTLESTDMSGGANFIVPDELYDEWINSTNWSKYNSSVWNIKKLSEYQYLIK